MNRRDIIKNFGKGTVVSLGAASVYGSDICQRLITPAQPLGPFYPRKFPIDTNADLTVVSGRSKGAVGTPVLVRGIVQDENCRPVEGAIVEIWQACHTGKYNHPSDTSRNDLDPNFQYYALVRTNSRGEYSFKTIFPGAYDASADWRRPPHIHFKISLRGYKELVTQLYFKGQRLNNFDKILQDLSQEEQRRVVVSFKEDSRSNLLTGKFIINLKKL
jgi:protocatechuate 3,4-dioxygenase beta subunit